MVTRICPITEVSRTQRLTGRQFSTRNHHILLHTVNASAHINYYKSLTPSLIQPRQCKKGDDLKSVQLRVN